MTGKISEYAKARVRAYTEGNMDGLVTILRGGRGELNKVTLEVSGLAGAQTIYDDDEQTGAGGKARVHKVTGQGSVSVAGAGNIDMRQVIVSIPFASQMPRRDDVVLVRDSGEDQDLTGATLRVVEVDGGGAFGDARRMSCTLWGKSPRWTGTGSGATV